MTYFQCHVISWTIIRESLAYGESGIFILVYIDLLQVDKLLGANKEKLVAMVEKAAKLWK